jgi:hypothetical protein
MGMRVVITDQPAAEKPATDSNSVLATADVADRQTHSSE